MRATALLVLLSALPAAAQPRASCPTETVREVIAGVTERGEIRLAERLVRLSDLRLPEGAPGAQARDWLASHAGKTAQVAAAVPDRWGRHPASVTVEDETGPLDLARNLVAAGLALVDAEAALCRPELLALEGRARAAGLGLWASDRYKPVAAADLKRLEALVGRFALVEGRILSVGERRQRTYLNFGRDWKTDLTITIPKPTWAILRERGLTAAALRGRRVRARGVVEEWQGPALTLWAADLLELLDEDPSRR